MESSNNKAASKSEWKQFAIFLRSKELIDLAKTQVKVVIQIVETHPQIQKITEIRQQIKFIFSFFSFTHKTSQEALLLQNLKFTENILHP